jgi:hypothetical protein
MSHHGGQLAHQCQALLHAELTDELIECDGFAGIHTLLMLLWEKKTTWWAWSGQLKRLGNTETFCKRSIPFPTYTSDHSTNFHPLDTVAILR